jgi:hypothetical protein
MALALPALTLIHRSAWNTNSANFAFWAFSEVRIASVLYGGTSYVRTKRVAAMCT